MGGGAFVNVHLKEIKFSINLPWTFGVVVVVIKLILFVKSLI